MSGLEVVGLVAAVVSAFHGGKELFSAWRRHRDKKRAKKQQLDDKAVEASMVKGKSKVQKQYDEDFRRLGERFAKGDDQARLELYHHMTTMQSAIIDSLRQAMGGSSRVVVNVDSLHAVSEAARKGSIAALTNQFQRMMQAGPIPKIPLTEAEDAKSGPDEQISVARCTGSLVVQRQQTGHVEVTCSSARCGLFWDFPGSGTRADYAPGVYLKDNNATVRISAVSLLRHHGINNEVDGDSWLCPICSHLLDDWEKMKDIDDHLGTHTLPEICKAFEILTEGHGSNPSSSLYFDRTSPGFLCWEAGCHFKIPVDDVKDAEIETWDGRLEIFRHKGLQYNWRLLAPYLLGCHIQGSNRKTIMFKCPICGHEGAEESNKRIALQLFLGHIRVHDPSEIIGLWNENVHDYCKCFSSEQKHDWTDMTTCGAIELVSEANSS